MVVRHLYYTMLNVAPNMADQLVLTRRDRSLNKLYQVIVISKSVTWHAPQEFFALFSLHWDLYFEKQNKTKNKNRNKTNKQKTTTTIIIITATTTKQKNKRGRFNGRRDWVIMTVYICFVSSSQKPTSSSIFVVKDVWITKGIE